MDEQSYPFQSDLTEYSYSFESISEQKKVRKVVIFTAIGLGQFYNLALLDELIDGTVSDSTTTDNNDLITVLATVFRITENFLDRFPDAFVYFSGSDARRTRLYRIVIGRELARLQEKYVVLGRRGDEAFPFVLNQKYNGFLIGKK